MCSVSISNITGKITSAIAGVMPNVTVASAKANKAIDWIGRRVSSPQNRLILGATALMSQPFIDLNNKKVDEETRKVSAARTVAKIVAGASTGFLVRYGCIKAIDYCSLLPEAAKGLKNPRLRTLFTPDIAISGILKDLNHYKKAVGSFIALSVMLFTNFLIDAPLTKFLTNKLVDKYGLNKDNRPQQHNSPVIFPLIAQKNAQKNKEADYA